MQNFRLLRRAMSFTRIIVIATGLGACTTVSVTPVSAPAPTQSYHAAVVQAADQQDPALKYYTTFFREGLVRRLRELNNLTVSDATNGSATTDTIMVVGTVTEVDKGSQALRGFIGFGAGRAHVTATLDLQGNDGKPLGKLVIRKAYSGGAGMGGFGDLVDMEELAKQVGEQAAQSLTDWSLGKQIASE